MEKVATGARLLLGGLPVLISLLLGLGHASRTLAGPRETEQAWLDPLAISAEQARWARKSLARPDDSIDKLRLLSLLLNQHPRYRFREVTDYTPAAEVAFQERRGDCVAYAHVFVALARAAGVPAHFVFSMPTEQIEAKNGFRVHRKHLAAGFENRVYDLGGLTRFDPTSQRMIADRTAAGIFLSNRGVHLLQQGRAGEAVEWLYRSVRLDPGLTATWTNLGVALLRSGDRDGAAQAYEMALRIDPRALAPQRNLARLAGR